MDHKHVLMNISFIFQADMVSTNSSLLVLIRNKDNFSSFLNVERETDFWSVYKKHFYSIGWANNGTCSRGAANNPIHVFSARLPLSLDAIFEIMMKLLWWNYNAYKNHTKFIATDTVVTSRRIYYVKSMYCEKV